MILNQKRWQTLFFLCLGLAIGSSFCMKWMESDFVTENGKFTIMGLELFYPLEKVETILKSLDSRVKTILNYHLHFDFAFMAAVFPGIAALCMIAREKIKKSGLKKMLTILATLQLLAWILDIAENIFLIGWLKNPAIEGRDFMLFHFAVATKWIIALVAAFTAVAFFGIKRKSE